MTRWVDNTHYYFGNVLVTIHPEMRTDYNLSGHVVYWQTTATNEKGRGIE